MGRKPRSDPGEQVFNRLETARDAHGYSRQQLADAVGVHYQTVGYLERGEYSPSLALALRIARLLDTPVEQLFALEPLDDAPAPTAEQAARPSPPARTAPEQED
jgi:putative transcriptional regulator